MSPATIPVQLNGQRIALRVNVRDAGTDWVLLLHGLGCSSDAFSGVWEAPAFAARSLLVPDLVGFGASAAPEAFDFTMEAQARVCDALLEQFPGPRVHVVAHSMGGAVALLLAPATLARCASMALVEGNLEADDCDVISRRAVRMPFERFARQFFPALRLRAEAADDPLDLARTSARAVHQSARSLVSWSDSDELVRRFAALACRRAYLHGADSGNPGACQGLDGVHVRAVPQAGHFVMNDNPAGFYAALGAFLDGATQAS